MENFVAWLFYNSLFFSFSKQQRQKLTFAVYNKFIGHDGIAICFDLWSHYQAAYINISS
jgi:hypothetical protein